MTIMTARRKKKDDDSARDSQEPESKAKDRHLDKKMVRIPKRYHKLFKELAKRNNRPLSWEIRMAWDEYLKKFGLSVEDDESE